MDKLLPTSEPNMMFLDHFKDPWKAVGWAMLVVIVITIFILIC